MSSTNDTSKTGESDPMDLSISYSRMRENSRNPHSAPLRTKSRKDAIEDPIFKFRSWPGKKISTNPNPNPKQTQTTHNHAKNAGHTRNTINFLCTPWHTQNSWYFFLTFFELTPGVQLELQRIWLGTNLNRSSMKPCILIGSWQVLNFDSHRAF